VDSKVELPNGEHVPCLLLANKCDLAGSAAIDAAALDKFTADHGFIGWFATSALSDTNVEKAMQFLTAKITDVAARCAPLERPADAIALDRAAPTTTTPAERSSGGCCGSSS